MRSKLILVLLSVAVLSFGAWSYRGEAATQTATSYEYQVLQDNSYGGAIKQLNEFGAQGWELSGVAVHDGNGMTVLYLKRTRK